MARGNSRILEILTQTTKRELVSLGSLKQTCLPMRRRKMMKRRMMMLR